MADDDKILQNLQSELQNARNFNQNLSTLARQGNEKLVQSFWTENVKIQSLGPFAKVSQLYVASFWGLKDSVKQLLDAGADPNSQNDGTLWTPLHAATFQEHGLIIMLLLEHGAKPELRDAEERTPADFASASDKIWPFFAALEIPRTPGAVLVEKGILRPEAKFFALNSVVGENEPHITLLHNFLITDYVTKVWQLRSGSLMQKEAGSGIEMAEYRPSAQRDSQSNSYLAAISGDVLANEPEHVDASDPKNGLQPQFSVWK